MIELRASSNVLAGGGVSGALIRSIDWSKTAVGPVTSWSRSLLTIVETILHSRHPMFLWWGPELIQFYNDAYLPSFGTGKHPAAMGQPGRECWGEIWSIIGPQIENVMAYATPTWHEDALVPIQRNDRIEEVYWTYGYSPVFDDDRRIGGTLVICTETTARVLASRRERLFEGIVQAATSAHPIASVLDLATASAHDVPFAVAFDAGGATAARSSALSEGDVLQLAQLVATSVREATELDLPHPIQAGPWPEPVTRAFAVPLRRGGVAVFGLSPRLPFDASYRDLVLRVVDRIGIAQERAEAAAVRVAAEQQRTNLYRHFMQAPFPIAVFRGPDHVIELANPPIIAAWGKGPEIIGSPLMAAVPELQGQPFLALLDDVFRTGIAFEGKEQPTLVPIGPGGALEEIYSNFVYAPLRSADGAIEGVLLSAFLVTEQVRARQTLERTLARAESSEAQLRDLVNNLPEMAWEARPDGHIEFFNQRWYDYTGTTLAEMRGWGWTKVHDPTILPLVLERWQGALASGTPFVMEFPLRRADGVFRWFLTRAIPLREPQGRIVRWLGINTDVDDVRRDRQRVEALAENLSRTTQRLHAAQRAAQVGIFDWDVIGDRVSLSPELYVLMGLVPGAVPATRQACIDAVAEEDRARVWSAYGEAVKARDRLLEVELRLRPATGAPRWVRLSTELEYDDAGATMRAVGAVVNIQDLKEAAEQRERALAEAERINRAKDEFLATMSHELRTPLNAILGWATMLRSIPGDMEKLERGLAVIERNAEAQARLISDLLDVSRIISGKLRLAVQRVDVVGAIHAALDVVRPAAEAKGVHLVAALSPDTGAVVADPDRLQQVVWNLLSNAVKFTPADGTVRVTAERIASRVQICVVDTGAGIAREHLPAIFERFRQIDGSITRSHGGLGLGLAIVRHLAEAHGGTVTADSEGPGTGATFTVEIPVRAIYASDAQQLHRTAGRSHQAAPPAAHGRLAGVRVLAVDDEHDSLELLRLVLEMAGATVISASSAKSALSEAARSRFDLVISDIGMPEVDGYSFMRQLRSRDLGGDVPSIALTAYARAEDAAQAFRAGYKEHVTKPVDAAALVATVERLVRR
jgi:PAS domain S-box-containing protein